MKYCGRSGIYWQSCLKTQKNNWRARQVKLLFPLFLLTMVSAQTRAIQLDAEARFSILSRG